MSPQHPTSFPLPPHGEARGVWERRSWELCEAVWVEASCSPPEQSRPLAELPALLQQQGGPLLTPRTSSLGTLGIAHLVQETAHTLPAP